MKYFIWFVCFFCCTFFTGAASAWDIPSDTSRTLMLTIINHSSNTLRLTGIHPLNPLSHFSLSTHEILPGGVAMLTASTSSWFDLAMNLRFSDGGENGNLLRILDPRKERTDTPGGKFSMNNDRFVSFVSHRAFSEDNNPNSLTYTAATVEIQNRFRLPPDKVVATG